MHKLVVRLSHGKPTCYAEKHQCNNERPEELLFAVAERMRPVSGFLAAPDPYEQEDLVQRIGKGMVGLRKHG